MSLDDFYDLCDEKGLMIWQDFMFSCNSNPATKEFLANVREEVIHQVKASPGTTPVLPYGAATTSAWEPLNWFDVSRRNRDRYLVDY